MSAQPADERNAPVNSDPSPGGTDGTYASAPMAPVLAPANGLGTTGMVLGIVGAALCLVPVIGFLLGLLATILHSARSRHAAADPYSVLARPATRDAVARR
jgi:hypothetical protein